MVTALSISEAVDDGLSRLTSRQLLPLGCVAVVVQLLSLIGAQSQIAAQREQLADEPLPPAFVPETLPLAVDVPVAVATGAWLLAMVLFVTVSIVAFRAFLAIDTADEPLFQTEGLLRGTAHGVAATVILALCIGAGLLAVILPGLFLATVFAFTLPSIAAEQTTVPEAMRRSYELTSGHRFRVFGVLLAIVGGFFAISFLGTIGFLVFGTETVAGELVNGAVGAIAWLFGLAVLASAFEQLEEIDAEQQDKWEGIDDELLP